jgi:hypothetical protein
MEKAFLVLIYSVDRHFFGICPGLATVDRTVNMVDPGAYPWEGTI